MERRNAEFKNGLFFQVVALIINSTHVDPKSVSSAFLYFAKRNGKICTLRNGKNLYFAEQAGI